MAGFNTPCLDCGVLVRGATRCDRHQAEWLRSRQKPDSLKRRAIKAQRYDSHYQKVSKLMRQAARSGLTECYICGQLIAGTDDIQIDHVYPSMGNQSPLAPVHARCNRAKSNKPPEGL